MLPDQAPEAVHEVAFAEVHDNVDPLPFATLLGAALSLIVGGVALTVTVADCAALPPGPVHVKV